MEAAPRSGDAVLRCRTYEPHVNTQLRDTGGLGGNNAGTRIDDSVQMAPRVWRALDVVMPGDESIPEGSVHEAASGAVDGRLSPAQGCM